MKNPTTKAASALAALFLFGTAPLFCSPADGIAIPAAFDGAGITARLFRIPAEQQFRADVPAGEGRDLELNGFGDVTAYVPPGDGHHTDGAGRQRVRRSDLPGDPGSGGFRARRPRRPRPQDG